MVCVNIHNPYVNVFCILAWIREAEFLKLGCGKVRLNLINPTSFAESDKYCWQQETENSEKSTTHLQLV